MSKFIAIILVMCMSGQALACDVPTKIKKGEASPCEGYVMSNATEEKIRIDLQYKDALIKNLTEASDLQAEIIAINGRQLDLYREEVNKQKQLSTWEKAMYFGLGALVTGAVAYGTVTALRN